MKRFLLFFFITISLLFKAEAQCSSNSLFTSLGIPGVFPPSIPIPGLPILGISDGFIGNYYSETLTLVVLEDTILDVASFLPSNVLTAMNLAGISTVMTLNVNHAIFNISGLPNGISYNCDQNNCEYLLGVDGCILIDGIPIETGLFDISVEMIINVHIPPILNPIGGNPVFSGMDIDLPLVTAQEYELLINGTISVEDKDLTSHFFPNPTSSLTMVSLQKFSEVTIYDVFGKEVAKFKDVNGNFVLNKKDIGPGVFFINISSNNYKRILRLIIN
tara:strand:+ start:612 stop:1436 length:825 start_codon:yes stop_codon:yes gene_type:complete